MCTIVVLRRPGDRFPVLIAANRDELADRPWRAPGRHWPDRPEVTAGLDEVGRGTWLGLNDAGVAAAVLNRLGSLGPAPGRRSRGGLPLAALAEASAERAARRIAREEAQAYRPFNLLIADRDAAFWLRAAGDDARTARAIACEPLPEGLSMITAYDRNDPASPRIRRFLPRFEAAAVPDPAAGAWGAWQALLASRDRDEAAGPGGAMTVETDSGFGTVSSSLLALPADPARDRPVWLFAAGPPDRNGFDPVAL